MVATISWGEKAEALSWALLEAELSTLCAAQRHEEQGVLRSNGSRLSCWSSEN